MNSTIESFSPIIISTGHRISLNSALTIVKNLTKYRVPEPIRLADKRSRFLIRDYETNPYKYLFDKSTSMSLIYNNPKEVNDKDSVDSD